MCVAVPVILDGFDVDMTPGCKSNSAICGEHRRGQIRPQLSQRDCASDIFGAEKSISCKVKWNDRPACSAVSVCIPIARRLAKQAYQVTCRDGFSEAECRAAPVQENGARKAGRQRREKGGGRGIGMTVCLSTTSGM